MNRRLTVAHICVITFFLSLGASAVITTLAFGSQQHRGPSTGLKPITNKMAPNVVERHFAEGKEYSQASAKEAVGMKDGTCYVYTNEVSWLAMECFGGVRP